MNYDDFSVQLRNLINYAVAMLDFHELKFSLKLSSIYLTMMSVEFLLQTLPAVALHIK